MKIVLFVVIPLIEIVAAFIAAHFIGWGWTVLALLVLSCLGAWQVKVQGLAAWRTASREIAEGASPAPAVLDGVIRLVGALLVSLPGFVSAIIGGLLLASPVRRLTSRRAGFWVVTKFRMPFVVVQDDAAAGWRFRSSSEPDYVDVDGWEDSTDPDAVNRPMLRPGSSPG